MIQLFKKVSLRRIKLIVISFSIKEKEITIIIMDSKPSDDKVNPSEELNQPVNIDIQSKIDPKLLFSARYHGLRREMSGLKSINLFQEEQTQEQVDQEFNDTTAQAIEDNREKNPELAALYRNLRIMRLEWVSRGRPTPVNPVDMLLIPCSCGRNLSYSKNFTS
jgi:hypothetical protein